MQFHYNTSVGFQIVEDSLLQEANSSHQCFNLDETFPDTCRRGREGWKGEVSHLSNIKGQPLELLIMTEIWSVVPFLDSIEQSIYLTAHGGLS